MNADKCRVRLVYKTAGASSLAAVSFHLVPFCERVMLEKYPLPPCLCFTIACPGWPRSTARLFPAPLPERKALKNLP